MLALGGVVKFSYDFMADLAFSLHHMKHLSLGIGLVRHLLPLRLAHFTVVVIQLLIHRAM